MKLNIKKLEAERERRKMCREDFSRFLGMHWTTYGKMVETESTTLKRITSMATILGVKDKSLVA
ncbi:MAG: hypothetical protein WC294_08150 [Methanoregula sp.]|jgi:hypothetical protein